jgi:hypothetical protein
MFRLPKSVLSFGAGALALCVLILAAPRAAHAIAATLVQVTNTTANPAITQSVGQQASQLASLGATTIGGQPSTFLSFLPNNTYVLGYAVPANQYLVITSADIMAQGCPSVYVSLFVSNLQLQSWIVSGTNTSHFAYPSGFVIAPGATPLEVVNGPSSCSASLQLNGYLTSN